MPVRTRDMIVGKNTNKKNARKIGLTEQLVQLDVMAEKSFSKQLKRLHKRLTRDLAQKIEETSTALNKRSEVTGFELIDLADPWSATAEFLNPMDLTMTVVIPHVERAAISAKFFINDSDLYLVPESYALAVPVKAETVIGDNPVYAMADPDDIVDIILTSELWRSKGEMPTGARVGWILQWLDNLTTDGDANPHTEATSN